MKICVFGNSHTGMLIQAAKATPDHGFDFTYFAKAGHGPAGAELSGTSLIAKDDMLRQRLQENNMPIDLDLWDYDAFVIVAMGATVFQAAKLSYDHMISNWHSSKQHMTTLRAPFGKPAPRPLISADAYEASLCHYVKNGLAFQFATLIRKVSEAPILFVPQPLPSAELIKDKDNYYSLRRVHHNSDGKSLATALRRAHEVVYDGFDNALLLGQPEDTIVRYMFTKREFISGASRLDPSSKQPKSDILHTNLSYGERVLNQISSSLAWTD